MEEMKRINKSSCTNRIVITRNLFLRGLALIYLISFTSIYGQIQGLFGDEGIFPVKLFISKLRETQKSNFNIITFPSMIWLFESISNYINQKLPFTLTNSYAELYLYSLCIIGIIISFLILLNQKHFIKTYYYALLWYIYFNFVLLGQTFMRFEWDLLLLETGFVSILFAPLDFYKYGCVITNIDNICFYILRFILFKVFFATGANILSSNCPYWLSFNGLNFYFQSQPLLSNLSITAHNFPENLKKLLTAFGYFVIDYIPFFYFGIWRRINIYAGQVTFLFTVFININGNYSFYGLLILVINLLNFDDYFWRGILPKMIIAYFDIDPMIPYMEKYLHDVQIKKEKYEKLNEENNELIEKLKHTKDEKEKKEIEKKMFNIKREAFSFDDFEDCPKIEESMKPTTTLIKEIFIFLNFFSVNILVIFFLLFPIKNLLTGRLLIKHTKKEERTVLLNIYLIYVFIFFIVVMLYNISLIIKNSLIGSFDVNDLNTEEIYDEANKEDEEKDQNKENKDNKEESQQEKLKAKVQKALNKAKSKKSKGSCITNCIKYFIQVTRYIALFILFMIYYIGQVNSIYGSLDLKLYNEEAIKKEKEDFDLNKAKTSDKKKLEKELLKPNISLDHFFYASVGMSNMIFQRFFAFGQYGQIQKEIIGINGRPELEFEYMESNSKEWKELNFMYKLGPFFKPKFLFFYLPRIDYQMAIAARKKDINSEPWIAILMGKLFEKNPVIMDLLGYEIEEKEIYYKISMFDKIKKKYLGVKKNDLYLENNIKKIKIDLFNYRINKKNIINKKDQKGLTLFQRKRIREFLGNFEKYALSNIFKMYGLPEIDENRKIHYNYFQLIPINDLIIIALLLFKFHN